MRRAIRRPQLDPSLALDAAIATAPLAAAASATEGGHPSSSAPAPSSSIANVALAAGGMDDSTRADATSADVVSHVGTSTAGGRFRGLGPMALSLTTDKSMTSTAASYVVSDSGAMFSLGNRYHVTSSGVQEFKRASRSLGVAVSSETGLVCRHVDELDFDHGLQIGRGSSGKVFDVLHVPSGVRVCVKQMLIDDARHRDEIKRELDSLHKVPNRFIVDFYGAFFHHDLGVVLLVLELMDGSLQELLKLTPRVPEAVVRAFALQLVLGLKVLHSERTLIHRDIKPGNILFHRSGAVKITDFGISRGQVSHDPTSVHTFVGSILYMSPERLEGRSYGYECDIWSLGITLVECLTGAHPFQLDVSTTSQPPTFWGLLQAVTGPHRISFNILPATVERLVSAGDATAASIYFSAEMVDFIDACLRVAKEDRPSAAALLQHPWLRGLDVEQSEAVVRAVALDAATLKQSQSGEAPTAAAATQRTEALLDDFVSSVDVGGSH